MYRTKVNSTINMTWYTMQIALTRHVEKITLVKVVAERTKDHNGRDLKSHILRHSVESGHANVRCEDFKIIAKNFNNNSWKRKIAESLLIKEKRPTLNIHDKSVPLKLFN